MDFPETVPVMILPNATLFPQAMLPLRIFEPRYRRMLADALKTHRMFAIALRRPGRKFETPSEVAGLGLIRACVRHKNGTSHLILEGLARVKLGKAGRYRPYRVHRIEPMGTILSEGVMVDALTTKVRELVRERVELGREHTKHLPPDAMTPADKARALEWLEKFSRDVASVNAPDQLADLVSCAFLTNALARQAILEAVELGPRLKRLIHFLLIEIDRQRKEPTP
jgi:Lon protease-like protein